MIFEKFITNIYKNQLLVRHDPDGSIFYYSPEDFALSYRPFEFTGDKGQTLRGFFYTVGETKKEKLIVFDHGMGCGHKAYMREILTLCEAGYEVFAYDHTGTLSSDGENIGGFSQSLADLDLALDALKSTGAIGGRSVCVIGHSWGAFSTLNISAFHRDITHIVAMSGFVSVRDMLEDVLGAAKRYAPAIFRTEAESFPTYAYADARVSLKISDSKALIIHSRDDATCPFSHFEKLQSALGDRPNTVFMALDGKRHNPNFTADAVAYKDGFFAELTRKAKKKQLATPEARAAFVASYDWERMTAQDTELWEKVIAFIES